MSQTHMTSGSSGQILKCVLGGQESCMGPKRPFSSGHCHHLSFGVLPPLWANSSPGDKRGSISGFSHSADSFKPIDL